MTAENSDGKQRGRPFQKGQSGNPKGKPKGTRHRTTMAAEALLDGEAQALTRKAIELAQAGDVTALRLCLDRIVPPRRERPAPFKCPPIRCPGDAAKALAALVTAVGAGDLTPGEAADVAKLIDAFIRVLEATELEERIRRLEKKEAPPYARAI